MERRKKLVYQEMKKRSEQREIDIKMSFQLKKE
jgi:hypothetical protein